jgi:hypothetical protein
MLRLSLVVVFATACSSDGVSAPLRVFTYAAAQFQCGPADGPAVAIYLAPMPVGSLEPSTPYVRIYVPVALNHLTGRIWPISDGNSEASAWFRPNGSSSELATSGYMSVSSIDPDNSVSGTVDIRFPDAGRIRSVFRAKWLPQPALCG